MNSTLYTKLKARLQYNKLTKLYLKLTTIPKHETIYTLNLTKWHYQAILACSLIGNQT